MGNRSLLEISYNKLLVPIFIIFVAALMRLLPHPANIAPIAAMALFGGVYLKPKYAILLPLCAMVISDIFLGFDVTSPFVYVSFIITGCIGIFIKKHKKPLIILSASFVSSLLFFLITNLGVWLVGGLYQNTLQGLLLCYMLAIPFFRNTIVGDLFYTILFFGGYQLIVLLLSNKLSKSYENLYKNR